MQSSIFSSPLSRLIIITRQRMKERAGAGGKSRGEKLPGTLDTDGGPLDEMTTAREQEVEAGRSINLVGLSLALIYSWALLDSHNYWNHLFL